jgi:hypothetical protein
MEQQNERREKFEAIFQSTIGDYYMLAGLILQIADKLVKYDITSRKFMQCVHEEDEKEIQEILRAEMAVYYQEIKGWLAQVLPTVEEGFAVMFPKDEERYGGFIGALMRETSTAHAINQIRETGNPDAIAWAEKFGPRLVAIENGLKYNPEIEAQIRDTTMGIKQQIDQARQVGNEQVVAEQYGDVPYTCDLWRLVRNDILNKGLLFTKAELDSGKDYNIELAPVCAYMYQCPYSDRVCPIRAGLDEIRASREAAKSSAAPGTG